MAKFLEGQIGQILLAAPLRDTHKTILLVARDMQIIMRGSNSGAHRGVVSSRAILHPASTLAHAAIHAESDSMRPK